MAQRVSRRPVLALLVGALAACTPLKPDGPAVPRASANGRASASPGAGAGPLAPGTASPAPKGGASAQPTPVPVAALRAGQGQVRTLVGQVAVDAAYALAAGGAQLLDDQGTILGGASPVLSHNGGALVAAGAGNVLSHNGAQLIAAGAGNVLSHNGGALVAAGGGNLVAAGAGNLVAAGAGNVISHNGGAVLSHNGGTVLSHNGGAVITHNGAVLVFGEGAAALTSGNAIAPGGAAGLAGELGGHLLPAAGMVAAGAGNLVAAGAGNLVAAGAGNLVAAGAGNLVAAGAGNYWLAQATVGPTAIPTAAGPTTVPGTPVATGTSAASGTPGAGEQVAPGQVVPAAGVALSVVSLADHRYLPLGVDAQGQPVYAVYTNGIGRFEVYLPAGQAENVLVVAAPPGAPDPRMAYGLLHAPVAPGAAPASPAPAPTAPPSAAGAGGPAGAPLAAGELPVDETSRLVSRYVREALTQRLVTMLAVPELAKKTLDGVARLTPTGRTAITTLIDRMVAIRQAAGTDADADEAVARRRAQRLVDTLLASVDLEALRVDKQDVATNGGPEERLMPAFTGCVEVLLKGAADRFADDPGVFDQAFLASAINRSTDAELPPLADYEIKKPSDVGDFLLTEYIGVLKTGASDGTTNMFTVLTGGRAALAPTGDSDAKRQAIDLTRRLDIAGFQLLVSMARKALTDEALNERLRAILVEKM